MQNLTRPRRGVGSSGAAGLGQELRQVDRGASAEVADYFRSAQTADLAADGKRQRAGQAIEEAAGVKVAGSGRVDDARNRRRRDAMLGSGRQDDAARLAARQGSDCDMP